MPNQDAPASAEERDATLRIRTGRAMPLGAAVEDDGVNFAVVSRHATRVWLALFDKEDDEAPYIEFELDPRRHRIGDVWNVFVEGLHPGALFMYRMDGPWDPQQGHRFDPRAYLLDPYAQLVAGQAASGNAKCVVIGKGPGHQHDLKPRVSMRESIVYETHVRGFTIHESAGVEHAGTYRGLIEKIPYLKDLGVTAVELLPIQEIGETELERTNPDTGETLTNYWGYNTIAFFAPAARYACEPGVEAQLHEFREMVAHFHRAGMEVILDVVFNHTAEGNEQGPTLCFRGLDNAIYYILDDEGNYLNFSGCGNTMNCNHPILRDLIRTCLHYWVTEMHVDGFRFDLASVLGRDKDGRLIENPPVIERIAEDPLLRDTTLIAEAWDAGGAYQVGSFGGTDRWAEWNGRYRDDVRMFWRGDKGLKGRFALRITGSPDLYESRGRTPVHSVNFITSHDGFTLHDLVSFTRKHNEANGENNRDGANDNYSWNYGVEGETDDPRINTLRLRTQKSLIATLFTSLGMPMLLGGDEIDRTQKGNNNAYCQDNEISWFNWDLDERAEELLRFTREVIWFRKSNAVFSGGDFFTGRPVVKGGLPDVLWYEADGDPMNWHNGGRALALWVNSAVNAGVALYLMYNPTDRAIAFALPEGRWQLRIDSAAPPPRDVLSPSSQPLMLRQPAVRVDAKAVVVLSAPGPSREELLETSDKKE